MRKNTPLRAAPGYAIALSFMVVALPFPTAAKTINVEIPKGVHGFVPPNVDAAPGDEIVWTNNNEKTPGNDHTISPDVDGDFPEKDPLEPGQSYKITVPNKPGVMKYHCNFHAMNGTITISGK